MASLFNLFCVFGLVSQPYIRFKSPLYPLSSILREMKVSIDYELIRATVSTFYGFSKNVNKAQNCPLNH